MNIELSFDGNQFGKQNVTKITFDLYKPNENYSIFKEIDEKQSQIYIDHNEWQV